MNLFAFSGFFWGATTLSLGIFVLRNGKTRLHRMWAIFNFVITIWALGYGIAAICETAESARFWWRIAHIGGPVNSVLLLHIVCVLGGLRRRGFLILSNFCPYRSRSRGLIS